MEEEKEERDDVDAEYLGLEYELIRMIKR